MHSCSVNGLHQQPLLIVFGKGSVEWCEVPFECFADKRQTWIWRRVQVCRYWSKSEGEMQVSETGESAATGASLRVREESETGVSLQVLEQV